MNSSNESHAAGSTAPAEWRHCINRKLIRMSAVAVAGLLLAGSGNAGAAVLNVYWSDRDNATLSVTNLAGGGTQLLAQNFNRLQDVDLDSNSGTLYFSDWGPVGSPGGEGSINRIQTDGTGLATVLNTGDAVHQLALDAANQRIYFTRAVSYDGREISRVDTDGANYTALQSTPQGGSGFGWFYSGLALDSSNDLLYWGDIGVTNFVSPNGSVNSMTTAGLTPTQLTPHVNGRGRGMALDQANQVLFYTAHNSHSPGAGGGLFSYDIANGIETQLINDTATGYWDIEIDPFDQRIWWTDYVRGEIRSAKFDRSDVQVELSGLTNPYGLALEVVPEPSTLVLAGIAAIGLLTVVARRHRRRRGAWSIAAGVLLFGLALLLPSSSASAVTINTVPVGNAGNAGEVQSQGTFGAVSYEYLIATTEVTNAQYAEFLNAKAASDPLELYNTSMGGGFGGITRGGSDGSYTYGTIAGRENMPVNYVSWYDSIRFANWLHNGQGSGDTETGAYTLLGGTPTPSNGLSITRNLGVATWWLTSEDEWYKAAYHKNDGTTGNYFDYPTSSDTAPIAEAPSGGSNSANYESIVGDLTDGGAYTASDSPYGTFDQGGNLREWNEALISGSFRGLRGGSYNVSASVLQSSFRDNFNPTSEVNSLGFRVATVPEPGTAVLGMIGFALTLWWRKRRK